MEATSCNGVGFLQPITSMRSTTTVQRALECGKRMLVYAALAESVVNTKGRLVEFHCKDVCETCTILPMGTRKPYTKRRRVEKGTELEDDVEDDEAVQDVESVYDAGVSCDSDFGGIPDLETGEEQLANNHDNKQLASIDKARRDGQLPPDIKIPMLSCYTEEEMEQIAVDNHLRPG